MNLKHVVVSYNRNRSFTTNWHIFVTLYHLWTGLDIVCDHTDDSQIRNALNVLKKQSNFVYWMKFRNCHLPRLTDYIFMSLEVSHLNIIRSNLSSVEDSALSALGSSLESLDMASNLLQEVRRMIDTVPATYYGIIQSYNKKMYKITDYQFHGKHKIAFQL